ncbi:Misato segment II tubulin-like domain-containing protein [Chaetomium sp. MPI-CAGE-AT-0009]|nr:Misato segment II tubulin-like domain-containing protein [Chaetomium sp. MPI-CAGE-AT-0009]
MHETITLQFGQQANYLATHFWNTQESYFTYSPDQPESPIDHDIHFRPGLAPDGTETFMPRTVIYDLKANFGTLRKVNALYDMTEDAGTAPQALCPPRPNPSPPLPLPRRPQRQPAPPRPTPATIRFFSDYARTFYHPRSVVPIHERDLGGAAAFDRHAAGEDLFADLDREHDLLDRDLRPFVEEADCMQGVQEKRLLRLANKARAITELYKQASIVVPLAVPERLTSRVKLDATSQWHTSALLAAAVESVMLPSRMKDPLKRESLSEIADVLNVMGKQSVAGLQMSFAQPGSQGQEDARQRKLSEEELSEGVQLDIRFAPSYQLDSYTRSNGFSRPRVFSQLVASRGYEEEESENVERDEAGRWVRRSSYEPVTKSCTTDLRFPLLDSFPDIFRGDDDEPLTESLNITSSLSTDSSVASKLKQLRSTVIRSIGLEDRETLGNDLMEMADEYHEGWSSGSDEGEDD